MRTPSKRAIRHGAITRLEYDQLVLALGSVTSTFGSRRREHTLALKRWRMRRRCATASSRRSNKRSSRRPGRSASGC